MTEYQLLSGTQIIAFNPILQAHPKVKNSYCKALTNFVDKVKCANDTWSRVAKNFYGELLTNGASGNGRWQNYYMYFLTDLAAITGYDYYTWFISDMDKYLERVLANFSEEQKFFASGLRYALAGLFHFQNDEFYRADPDRYELLLYHQEKQRAHWSWLKRHKLYKPMSEYFSLVENNLEFMQQKPFRILVTATMSAGKSTFINALVGKKVTLSQNLACTSKIHTIISKPYYDGFVCRDDGDLVLNVRGDDILKNNPLNRENHLATAIFFDGDLAAMRLEICDSPGVNANDHIDHKNIAEDELKAQHYDLLIYIMNATQLFTNDDDLHIDFVKENCDDTNVLFVINKIDMIEPETEDFATIVERVRRYLLEKKFKQPITICPMSSLAGLLVKQSRRQSLNRTEQGQLYNLEAKFDEMNLAEYYQKFFPYWQIEDGASEAERLLKTSGFAYVEKIIRNLILFS